MKDQIRLPFDYVTFIMVNNAVSAIHQRPDVPVQNWREFAKSCSRSFMDHFKVPVDEEALDWCVRYQDDKRHVYRQTSVLHQQVRQVFENTDYFPENINDYMLECLDADLYKYHNALLDLWRTHVTHINAMRTIGGLAKAFGAINNVATETHHEYECLYHRGMHRNEVPNLVNVLVDLYDSFVGVLKFPIWYTPVAKDKVMDVIDLFIVEGDEKDFHHHEVSITTLVGRIWLKSVPGKGKLGGANLKGVDTKPPSADFDGHH